MSVDTSELKNKITKELSEKLQEQATFNSELLAVIVGDVIEEIMAIRRYEGSGKNDAWILRDISRYSPIIKNIALLDYSQQGAFGQTEHSENSISRKWIDRNKLFVGVYPYTKMF